MVRFDGSNDRLTVSQNLFTSSAIPRTLFAVLESDDYRGHVIGAGPTFTGRLTSIGYGLGIFANKPFLKASDYVVINAEADPVKSAAVGNIVLSPENLRQAGPQIVAGSFSNAGSRLRTRCFITENPDPFNIRNLPTTRIGSSVNNENSDESFEGGIAEILIYDRELTLEEQNSVLSYLSGRYSTPISVGIDSNNNGIFDECDTGAVYLKDPEITVELLYPLDQNVMIENAINAESATTIEIHTEETHVEAEGVNRMELRFDLRSEYNVTTIHFWNFWDDNSDWNVDEMTFVFFDSANEVIDDIVLVPQNGYEDISAEDFPVDFFGVRYIEAEFRSNENRIEFMNIGFTGVPVNNSP